MYNLGLELIKNCDSYLSNKIKNYPFFSTNFNIKYSANEQHGGVFSGPVQNKLKD